ncbi:MAG: CDF family zinc transporter ZitB [Chloroflexota bacterium]
MARNHGHSMTGVKLRTAFALTAVILLVELIGGLLSHSLALLSDAGHVLTDIFALGLAWFATVQAERPADATKTYGYHRIGILAALANAVTLMLIVIAIAYEAVQRFQHPAKVTPWILFVSAAAAIVVNLYIGFGLRAEGEHNLNVRAAMLHVFGDVGAAIGVIVAGAVILLTAWYPADPLISLLIAVLISYGAWNILRETIDILMEATPRGLNVAQMVRDMLREPEVTDVHDLHIWTIAGGLNSLSAHVQLDDRPLSECDSLLSRLTKLLEQKYHIGHATIQLECVGCETTHLYCTQKALAHTHGGHAHHHTQSLSGSST